MRYNKKILMVATTALFTVGCIGLIGAMKYQNIKTEASDIKANDVAKVGVDASSESMEGETPSEGEKKMTKEVVEEYSYKGYEISFIRYKDAKTGKYLSDAEKSSDYGYKRTFREIIDESENSGWNYMLKELKGKKNKITAEIDWKRDEDKIVNGKFYGDLIRESRIVFKAPIIFDDDSIIQMGIMASFDTVAESGDYLWGCKSQSTDLTEYCGQWGDAYNEHNIKNVKGKLKKYEAAYKNKKEADKYLEMAKDKIKKEMKDVYGINIVKETKDHDTYEKYNMWKQDMLQGCVTLFGKTDDGHTVDVQYDLIGDYVVSWHHKYW